MHQKRRRLSRSAEFDRVYRHGRSAASSLLVVYAFPREPRSGAGPGDVDGVRLGVSVGRKVGGAVERNRVKRLLRECFWPLATGLPGENDYVIVARAGTAELAERDGAEGFRRELSELLNRLAAEGARR